MLAASPEHFDRVCDRLEKLQGVDFNQGLDARLLTDYHAERIGRIKGAIARLALDHSSLIPQWEAAYQLLRKYKVAKDRIRTYVLCGFESDPTDAWKRCEYIDSTGSYALPQWFHALSEMTYNAVRSWHRACDWTAKERDRIMQYYYQHRGEPL